MLGTGIHCDFVRRVWLCYNRINRRRRFTSLWSHAVADDQKNQHKQHYANCAGEMPLVEIRNLGPRTPRFPAKGEYAREKIALLPDGLNRSPDGALPLKKWDVRKRAEKEEEHRAHSPDGARIENNFAKRHHDDEHGHQGDHAEQIKAPYRVES